MDDKKKGIVLLVVGALIGLFTPVWAYLSVTWLNILQRIPG